MKITIAALAGTMLLAGSATAQDVWGNQEVDDYVKNHRPQTAREVADPFAVPAVAPTPASQIVISHRVYMTGATNAPAGAIRSAYWKYDPTTQTMELNASKLSSGILLTPNYQGRPAPVLPDSRNAFLGVRINGIDTFNHREEIDGGTGQNAYGAKVEITEIIEASRGIAELGYGIAEGAGPSVPRGQYSYNHKWVIAPEDARALSEHIVVQYVAVPRAWAPNTWILCGTHYSAATVRLPRSLSQGGCYLTSSVQAVRFVDSRDNRVIKEWTR